MTAVARAAALVAEAEVVLRRAKAGQDVHSVGANSVSLEILNHQLELVEQRLAQNQVLRPDVCLIVREKIVQLEMLGDAHVSDSRA